MRVGIPLQRRVSLTNKAFFERLFSNWIVKLLSVAAAVILFIFQRVGSLEERFFSVPLRYYVHESFVATDVSVGSVRINMRGPAGDIFNVLEDDIEAYVDVSDHENEGIFKSPVLLRKTGSAETVDVEMSVDPLDAAVTIEQKISKELEVVAQLKGYPAAGYELVQALTTPQLIETIGPRSHIAPIERLETGAVDLTGRREDFSVRVPILMDDEMVTIVGSSVVEIHGIVREIIVRQSFTDVDLRYLDLPPTLFLGDVETSGSIRLSGPLLLVESLRPDDLLLEVACGEIGVPGVFELPVRPNLPAGVSTVSFQPGVVSVRVEAYKRIEAELDGAGGQPQITEPEGGQ